MHCSYKILSGLCYYLHNRPTVRYIVHRPVELLIKKVLYKNHTITGSGELEFEEFVTLASRFMVEEDAEAMQQELKEAFRLYDKEGMLFLLMQ